MNNPIGPVIPPLPDGLSPSLRSGLQSAPVKADPLKDASQEFEAMFLSYLLKVMRSTVEPADTESDSSMGKGIYLEMFDNEIALNIARTRSLGLGDMLYQQLRDRQNSGLSVSPTPDVPAAQPVDPDAV